MNVQGAIGFSSGKLFMAKFKSFLKTKKAFIFWIIAGSILATVIALNFTSGEKKIDKGRL